MPIINPDDDGFLNLSDHDSFAGGIPHNTFSRMRDEDPLPWTDFAGGRGFWSIVRHADILKMNRNFRLLSSAQGIRMEDQSHEEYLARRTFQETDPPDHTKTRIKVSKAFSKPVIAQFEDQIRSLCDEILDASFSSSEFDAVTHIARQLPMRMLGQILAVPDKDLEWLVKKGDELIANSDPDYTDHVIDQVDTDEFRLMPFRSPAGAELYSYARELMDDRRAAGEDAGIMGMLLEPDEDGNTISEDEFRNFFCLLVAAGNDTTRYSIAASLHALANDACLVAQLQQADEKTWEMMPDEMIRWASPTFHFRRTALDDFEMHGKQVKKGDKVILWFVSANRDADEFERPFEIDIHRSPNRHVSFGQGGPHVCLGMWLARLEVRVLMQEFVKRVKSVEQAGEIACLRSNFVGGIKKLPLRIQLA
ncbi:MAG: cytochrome P450 [Pseudomonadota bacterium]